jgi:hypothetical protein
MNSKRQTNRFLLEMFLPRLSEAENWKMPSTDIDGSIGFMAGLPLWRLSGLRWQRRQELLPF